MNESETTIRDVVNNTFRAQRVKVAAGAMFVAPAHLWLPLVKAPDVRVASVLRLLDDLQHDIAAHRLRNDATVMSTTCRIATNPLALEINRIDAESLAFDELRPRAVMNVAPALRLRPFDVGVGVYFQPRATRPILFNIANAATPHVLVAGTTGSGKSMLLRSMLATLSDATSPTELVVLLADLKGGDALDGIGALENLPHVSEFTCDAERANDFVAWAVERIGDTERTHKILIVVDEMQELSSRAADDIKRLAQVGRSVGIHLWLATQYPNHQAIASIVKANLPVRLVGSVMSAVEANVAMGLPASGAERLPGRGAFLARIENQIYRVQNWLADDAACRTHVVANRARWRARRAPAMTLSSQSENVPDELATVFETYANDDGTLRRGGQRRAIESIFGRVPTGEPYNRARETVFAYLLTWNRSRQFAREIRASHK